MKILKKAQVGFLASLVNTLVPERANWRKRVRGIDENQLVPRENKQVPSVQKAFSSAYLMGFFILVCFSCNSDYTVRQKGYFKIDLPPHRYQIFDKPGYPYSFEYPVYADVVQDSTFFEDKPENPYWINIEFPSLNGKIYMSYKNIQNNNFDKLVDDAFKLTYKHSSKATAIHDSIMRTPNGVSGIFFKVGGNAATARQFFTTDSVSHFLRGALYFDATPNADSLNIVNDFLEVDMKHLINSLKWRN